MTAVPAMPTIEWRSATVSTNADAKSAEYRHGSMVATLNQTGGRGRHDRTWACPPGQSLAMSLVVDTSRVARATDITWLPLLAGLAVVDALRGMTDIRVDLKWPNDVLIDGLKVAGILCELTADGQVIVGVGINIAVDRANLPVPTATSLSIHGIRVDALDFAPAWRSHMLGLVDGGVTPAVMERLTHALDTIGRDVRADLPDGTSVAGRAVGLAPDGALVVESAGECRVISAGDVTHLRHQIAET